MGIQCGREGKGGPRCGTCPGVYNRKKQVVVSIFQNILELDGNRVQYLHGQSAFIENSTKVIEQVVASEYI